jgi:glycosyltransferase involved in cell wall biosynthesis
MSISVVIPAYNTAEHIGRAIDSVLGQSVAANEIIVVDDGSTDGTAKVVAGFGDKVKYIRQDNAGVSVARNTGIAAATGDWIAFLDSDDEWASEKLQAQSEHLRRNSDLKWTYSNFYQKQPGSVELTEVHRSASLKNLLAGREFFDDYLAAYANHGHAWTCTLMIRRDVFEKTGMFEPGMKRGQDNDLWFRIAYQFPKIGYLPEPLAVYHLDTPESSTKINDEVDFMVNLIDRQLKISAQFGRQDAFKPCVRHMLSVWIRQLLGQKRRDDVKILLNKFGEYISRRFQREICFRLTCPPVTGWIADLILQVKKIL